MPPIFSLATIGVTCADTAASVANLQGLIELLAAQFAAQRLGDNPALLTAWNARAELPQEIHGQCEVGLFGVHDHPSTTQQPTL
jgi:hypothetical protein